MVHVNKLFAKVVEDNTYEVLIDVWISESNLMSRTSIDTMMAENRSSAAVTEDKRYLRSVVNDL